MVEVDMQIAFGVKLEIHQAVAGQLLQHMIEKADACMNIIHARAVEIELNLNLGLISFTLHRSRTHENSFRLLVSPEYLAWI